MNIEIKKNLKLTIFGFSGIAINQDYTGKAFQLMDKMWKVVQTNGLKNKGLNIWVYEPNDAIFTGVELDNPVKNGIGLEQKSINLIEYAYYKHVGSYNLIKQVGSKMRDELKNKGLETDFPYVEIYGHWTNEETKLETELLMTIK